MKIKNILVTGGAGFIGSHLCESLVTIPQYKVTSLDNYFTGSKKNHIINNRVKYINGDNQKISILLNKYKSTIKVIYHFGEFSRIYQSFFMFKK